MPVKVNLIPDKFKTKGSLYQMYKIFMTISIIGTIVFFATVFAITVFILINDNNIKSLGLRQDLLTKQIQSLAPVETKYAFIKDRANLLKDYNQIEPAKIDDFYDLFTTQGDQLYIAQADITGKSIDFNAATTSTKKMLSFFDSLIDNQQYKEIDVTGYSFTKDSGFSMELKFNY